MEFALSVLIILALPATLILYVMYFISLYEFSRTLERETPDLLSGVMSTTFNRPSKLHAAYKVFSKIKNGTFVGQSLGPESLAAVPHLKRRLYIGVLAFLVLLFAALTHSTLYAT